METISLTKHKGVDDLKSTFAFSSHFQGNHAYTNNLAEGLNDPNMVFRFGDVEDYDQDLINKEVTCRERLNDLYIQQLKQCGEYKEPYTLTITGSPCEGFGDSVEPQNKKDMFRHASMGDVVPLPLK